MMCWKTQVSKQTLLFFVSHCDSKDLCSLHRVLCSMSQFSYFEFMYTLNDVYVEWSSKMFLRAGQVQLQIPNRQLETVDSQNVDSQSNDCTTVKGETEH